MATEATAVLSLVATKVRALTLSVFSLCAVTESLPPALSVAPLVTLVVLSEVALP